MPNFLVDLPQFYKIINIYYCCKLVYLLLNLDAEYVKLYTFYFLFVLLTRMQPQISHPKYAKLNIGGSLFYTTIGTLTKHDTMLKAMFSGRMKVLTDTEGTTR